MRFMSKIFEHRAELDPDGGGKIIKFEQISSFSLLIIPSTLKYECSVVVDQFI